MYLEGYVGLFKPLKKSKNRELRAKGIYKNMLHIPLTSDPLLYIIDCRIVI
jgi:hypothetical protein